MVLKFSRLCALALTVSTAWSAEPSPSATPEPSPVVVGRAPTLSNVPYGEHPRQVLDFYRAKSDRPTPVLFYLHGGGWVKGDKNDAWKRDLKSLLDAGISVVSANYRYTTQAVEAGVKPPVTWPMEDAARALQFVRSKASEWNIDKARIAGAGGSAGACSVLWLALHDDMADPKSSDPVSRESTRFACVALDGPQTTLDPKQMAEWTPNSRYGGHAFGFADAKDLKKRDALFAEFLAHREEVLPWVKQYSPIEFASAGDPPVYMMFKAPPAIGKREKDPTHTANFGVKLQEVLAPLGVECEIYYPGATNAPHTGIESYLMQKLRVEG